MTLSNLTNKIDIMVEAKYNSRLFEDFNIQSN